MRLIAFRLQAGDDLKLAIERYVTDKKLSAATILSAVGSLQTAVLRMAGAQPEAQDIRTLPGPFEIVSLIGNLGQGRTHIHLAVSDTEGRVIGGHLKEGSIVHTTCEVVLGAEDALTFSSRLDPQTGFEELDITGDDNDSTNNQT